MIYEVRVHDIFLPVCELITAVEIARRHSDLGIYALRKAQEGVWVAGGKFSTTCEVTVDTDLRDGYRLLVPVGVSWEQSLSPCNLRNHCFQTSGPTNSFTISRSNC